MVRKLAALWPWRSMQRQCGVKSRVWVCVSTYCTSQLVGECREAGGGLCDEGWRHASGCRRQPMVRVGAAAASAPSCLVRFHSIIKVPSPRLRIVPHTPPFSFPPPHHDLPRFAHLRLLFFSEIEANQRFERLGTNMAIDYDNHIRRGHPSQSIHRILAFEWSSCIDILLGSSISCLCSYYYIRNHRGALTQQFSIFVFQAQPYSTHLPRYSLRSRRGWSQDTTHTTTFLPQMCKTVLAFSSLPLVGLSSSPYFMPHCSGMRLSVYWQVC